MNKLTLGQTDIKREQTKVILSLLWHLGEQKREINTYMLSTYESNCRTVTFLIKGKYEKADARVGLLYFVL